MKVGNYKDVKSEKVDHLLPGAKGANIRWLIGDDLGKNFLLRRYDFDANATIPLHTHSHEHQMYVLSGKGAVLDKDGEHQIGSGDFVNIDNNELHGFKNLSSTESFTFLCIVPKKRGSTNPYESSKVK